jgi:methylmalonyl-CoA mutase cobalamin-binding domain/chain
MAYDAFDPLIQVLLDGDKEEAVKKANALLDDGIKPEDIVTHGVERAMQQLDAKCTVDQYNLLEIMLCGRATIEVITELYPSDENAPPAKKATVVLATVKGDIHDLGKNIVKMILTATGYNVVDCGKDCPPENIAETVEKEHAVAVGVSGLITPVIPHVIEVREALAKRGLEQVKVLAGGGALKQSTSATLNVDFVAETAFDGLHYLDQVVGVPQ